MFAIAILDKKQNKLILYRDRLGVKPLYFYKYEKELMFGSEIKLFKKYPNFDDFINNQGIYNYFRYQ